MKTSAKILCIALLTAFAGTAMAAKKDLDVQRLTNRLNQLQSNPVLGQYAQAQRALARQAVRRLHDAGSKRHAYALYIAERRVDIAKAAAQLAVARNKLTQLQQKHDQILLEASRQDAAATRRQLARERLANQVAAEQAARLQAQGHAYSQAAQQAQAAAQQAQAEAAQARKLAASQAHAAKLARHQASLASKAVQLMRQQMDHLTPKQGAEGMQMTLGGLAFASGQTTLRPAAKKHLGKLVQFVQSKSNKHIRIVGYTDSSGNAAVNQTLSLKRAQSVRDALVAKGVNASRISVAGAGESNPVASNSTAAGRAKNRRVVVILQSK